MSKLDLHDIAGLTRDAIAEGIKAHRESKSRRDVRKPSDSSLGDRARTKRVPSGTKELPSSLSTYP
jgi:hypothetical protein